MSSREWIPSQTATTLFPGSSALRASRECSSERRTLRPSASEKTHEPLPSSCIGFGKSRECKRSKSRRSIGRKGTDGVGCSQRGGRGGDREGPSHRLYARAGR